MANAAILIASVLLAIASPTPAPTRTPNPCATYLIMAGVQGMKVTPQNIGKLYASALAIRVQMHKGTPLEGKFTQADLNASARDIGACFLLLPEKK